MNTPDSDEQDGLLSIPSDLESVGRYRIVKKLGQGSAGVVFHGIDPYIKRQVAIKLSRMTTNKARERFFTEAQNTGCLNHPNIIAVYDVGLHQDFCYITMECVEGSTLEKFCLPESLLPLQKVMGIVLSVCDALDYAHNRKIIHRDIKPSNIMLDKDGRTKIADFGIAQMTEKTSEIGVWGTPSYMPPEQLKEEPYGNESDIFSLGCVMYELLTGRQAFPGENNFSIMYKITNESPARMAEIRPDLPEIFDKILSKAIAKNPKERYQTCMDMAYDLRVALRGLAVSAKDEKINDAFDFIHHIPFFTNFTKEQLKELVAASNIIKVPKGKVVVAEGDISDALYIILSGAVLVLKDGSRINTITVGDCFGEMSYLCGQARAATVEADTDCILMRVSAALLDRSPESVQLLFFRNFAITMVKRLAAGTINKQ